MKSTTPPPIFARTPVPGVPVPVTGRLSLVADMRFVLLGEDSDDGGVFLFGPIRGGLAWRF